MRGVWRLFGVGIGDGGVVEEVRGQRGVRR